MQADALRDVLRDTLNRTIAPNHDYTGDAASIVSTLLRATALDDRFTFHSAPAEGAGVAEESMREVFTIRSYYRSVAYILEALGDLLGAHLVIESTGTLWYRAISPTRAPDRREWSRHGNG